MNVLKKSIIFLIRSMVFIACLIWNLRLGGYAKLRYLYKIKKFSTSQIGQDLMVIAKIQDKLDQPKFFVEFGATNGISLSNTYLLEKRLGWKGICAEPAKIWHSELYKNRECKISKKAVFSTTGLKLNFHETKNPDLSTLESNRGFDLHRIGRLEGTSYVVETISLNDLLLINGAPDEMQFLSIDTEGSEYEILKQLDFDKYSFEIIVCEHNFTSSRKLVRELLESNGYVRRFSYISFWDDWYYLLRKD